MELHSRDLTIKSRRRGAIPYVRAHHGSIVPVYPDSAMPMKKAMTLWPYVSDRTQSALKGKIVTTGAMGCQKDIAEKIRNREGDYLLAVKGNQGKLYRPIEESFPFKRINESVLESFVTEDKNHGRKETRLHVVSDIPDDLIDHTFTWKELRKVGVAVSFRSELNDDKKEPEMQVRYYISSADLSAEKVGSAMQGNWSNENRLHWRLDVAMNEDDCRIRRGDAAEYFQG